MEVFIAIVTAILLVLMGLSLYFINYRAFHAAEAVNDQATPETSLDSLVAHTEEAVSAFPPLAVFPRRLSLRQTGALWGALSREDKARALDLAKQEGKKAIESEPKNPKLYTELATVYQRAAELDSANIGIARNYVTKAEELGPQHFWVQHLIGNQQLLEGDFAGVIETADEFERLNPKVGWLFRHVRNRAEQALQEAKER